MGTISTETQQLAEAVRLACIELRTKINGNQVTLNALNTTAKGSLVAAINEVLSLAGGGGSGAWDDITGKPAVITGTTASFTTALASKLDGIEAGATGDQDLSGLLTISSAEDTYAPLVAPSFTTPALGDATATSLELTTGIVRTTTGDFISTSGNFRTETGGFVCETGGFLADTGNFTTNSGQFIGSGAGLTNLNGSRITTGNIPVAHIATALNAGGNPISGTTGTFSGNIIQSGGSSKIESAFLLVAPYIRATAFFQIGASGPTITSTGAVINTSGGLSVGGNLTASGTVSGTEQGSPPAAPAANGYTLYAEDNGSGKTRLMVRFATGAAQQLAIEP